MYEFVYQIHQMNVNNFCQNKLFDLCALQDLSDLLMVNIVVFDRQQDSCLNKVKMNIYQPELDVDEKNGREIKEYIFLSYDKSQKIKYKWIIPKSLHSSFHKNILLDSKQKDNYFFKLDELYFEKITLFSIKSVLTNVSDKILNIFLYFLNEFDIEEIACSNKIDFQRLNYFKNDPFDLINFLTKNLFSKQLNEFQINFFLKELGI